VECDGFEYHDRTREQAIRDRMRDRTLQESGFRYAGAEIWADVFGCARQALGFLSARMFPTKKPSQAVGPEDALLLWHRVRADQHRKRGPSAYDWLLLLTIFGDSPS
jgi:hypothetical protein